MSLIKTLPASNCSVWLPAEKINAVQLHDLFTISEVKNVDCQGK